MGNSEQSLEQFNTNDWLRVADSSNLVTLWQNKNNRNYHIEEHKVYTLDQNQLRQQLDLYYRRKHHPRWVATLYFQQENAEKFCVSRSVAHLFIEKIPIRLNDLRDLPLPDVIHCYDQCLNGFQELAKDYGCFRVYPQYIGINEQGVVKVWAGDQWSQVAVLGGKISEEEMVRSIVECIEASTDREGMLRSGIPIRNYFYRGIDKLNFHRALYQLKNYTQLTNIGGVPSRLVSLFQTRDFEQFMEPLLRSSHDQKFTHNKNNFSNLSNTSDFPSSTTFSKVEQVRQAPIDYQHIHQSVRSGITSQLPQNINSQVPVYSPAQQHYQSQIQTQTLPQRVGSTFTLQAQPQTHIAYPSNYTFNHQQRRINLSSAIPQQSYQQVAFSKKPQVSFTASGINRGEQPLLPIRSNSAAQIQPALFKQQEHSPQLVSNESARTKKPIPESIIMELYRSEDRFGNNTESQPPLKEFGMVKRAESIMEDNKKFESATVIKDQEGNPILGFPQNQATPSYLHSIQELNSEHWKNEGSFTAPSKSQLEYGRQHRAIDPNDGKSSEELLNYLKFGR